MIHVESATLTIPNQERTLVRNLSLDLDQEESSSFGGTIGMRENLVASDVQRPLVSCFWSGGVTGIS